MTRDLFESITKWQKETFPESTAHSKVKHLSEEVDELSTELCFPSDDTGKAKRMEFADCFILLIGAAHDSGMTYEDIIEAINEKMEINKARKWGKPDEYGVVKHIEN